MKKPSAILTDTGQQSIFKCLRDNQHLPHADIVDIRNIIDRGDRGYGSTVFDRNGC
jgi:hypothetical protein